VVEGGDPETGLKIESAVVNVDLVGTGGACTAFMALVGSSASVVQVKIPIMNVSFTERTMEAGKLTIWLAREFARTPLPGAPLLMRCGRQSTEGYAHGSRLLVEVCKTMN
jgi:hypothetical protein